MKAAQITQFGHANVVHVVEVQKPQPGKGQVLVEVYASSLNPFDTTVREGRAAFPISLPIVLGGDIAGVVAEVGEGVDGFQPGDKVYGQANAVAGNSGAFAEFAATAANQIAAMPTNVDFKTAGCLPLVGVSAWQAMDEHIKLQAGQKLLVQGGSGGIGSIAIRIAKHIGAYVAATSPGDAVDDVKGYGADEVINYQSQDFTTLPHDFDAVFDTVGGDTFGKSLDMLKKGGVAVSMIGRVDAKVAEAQGVQAFTQATKVTTDALSELTKLVEAGVVVPAVAASYTLDQIQQAFEARESGKVFGKVVLVIKS